MSAPRSIPSASRSASGCDYPDCASPMSPTPESPTFGSLRSGSFESLLSPLRYMTSLPSRVLSDLSAPQSRRGSVSEGMSPRSPAAFDSRGFAAFLQASHHEPQNPVDRQKGMPSVEAFLCD